jgi:hydrogenase nickel incorporation protein HypA/HybF
MHEFTVTSWIVDALLELARKQGASRVVEVHLRIGKLRALSADQLMFCYEVLSKGTMLEGSTLVFEESAGKVRCENCGYSNEFDPDGDEYHYGLPILACPSCNGTVVVEGGDECVITKVRVEIGSSPKSTVTA